MEHSCVFIVSRSCASVARAVAFIFVIYQLLLRVARNPDIVSDCCQQPLKPKLNPSKLMLVRNSIAYKDIEIIHNRRPVQYAY